MARLVPTVLHYVMPYTYLVVEVQRHGKIIEKTQENQSFTLEIAMKFLDVIKMSNVSF